MLQNIHEKAKGWVAWIIAIPLAVAFGLWGIQNYLHGGKETTTVVTVNGYEITQQHLDQVYERLRREKQIQVGPQFLMSKTLERQLKKQALQHTVMTQILREAALKEGYRISPSMLDSTIEQMPMFQEQGQFSEERFQQILNALLYSPQQFLEDVQSSLLINQIQLGITETTFALPDEIKHAFELIDQRRDIAFLTIPKSYVAKSISVPLEKLQSYYMDHIKDYMEPAKVSVDYVELTVPELMKHIQLSDKELKEYYKNNFTESKGSFEQMKPKLKTMLAQQKAEQQFASLTDQLADVTFSNPKSLKEAAKTFDVPIKSTKEFTQKGGNTAITKNARVIEAAFSYDVLKQRNNSDVINLSNEAIVVIRVKTYKKSIPLPFEKVKEQIREQLIGQEITEKTEKLGKTIISELKKGVSRKEISQKYHLKWIYKDNLARHEDTPTMAIVATAFNLPNPQYKKSEEEPVGGVKLGDGYSIIVVLGVRSGKPSEKKSDDYKAFNEQIQNAYGRFAYDLYVRGLVKKAKIKPENIKKELQSSNYFS